MGCAIAYELARRGASVQVVEERTAGMGATQAAAGILAPHIEVQLAPRAFLDLAVRSLNLFDDFIARVQADSGIAGALPAHRHAPGGRRPRTGCAS